jgi:cytochrome c oxidase cbb3-type subunit 3
MLSQFSLEGKQRVDTPTAIAINPRSSLRWAFKIEESFSLDENSVWDRVQSGTSLSVRISAMSNQQRARVAILAFLCVVLAANGKRAPGTSDRPPSGGLNPGNPSGNSQRESSNTAPFGGNLRARSSLLRRPVQLGQPQRQNDPVQTFSGNGEKIFAGSCAECHGLDGRGGERAPNIAENPRVQRLSDDQIFAVIENGIPGTGMAAFHTLESSDIKSVVVYLRTLQGTKKTAELPGDPDRGKAIFFGKAKCSSCHMVAGKGGFIASDLSDYARTHSAEETRSTITSPNPTGDRQSRTVTATIRDGKKYVGRIRNEDNFSLQLQALDGTFHFLAKPDIERLDFSPQSLMPSDYHSTLSPNELNDLISYLMTSANPGESAIPKEILDEEE